MWLDVAGTWRYGVYNPVKAPVSTPRRRTLNKAAAVGGRGAIAGDEHISLVVAPRLS